jgi:PAS domain S-box-containing protein
MKQSPSIQELIERIKQLEEENALLKAKRRKDKSFTVKAEDDKDSASFCHVVEGKDLESLNEELLSTNQELSIVNDELQRSNNQLKKEIEQLQVVNTNLADNESKYRNFVTQSTEGIVIFDSKGLIQEWNPAMEQVTQLTFDDVQNKPIWEVDWMFTSPQRRTEEHLEQLKRRTIAFLSEVNNENKLTLESESYLSDGTVRYFQSSVFSFKTYKGWLVGRISKDTTDRVVADKQLEAYKNRLEQMVQLRTREFKRSREMMYSMLSNTSEIIWIIAQDSRILFESPSTHIILGYPEGSCLQKTGFDFIHPDDRSLVVDILARIDKKEVPVPAVEFRLQKADGSYIYVDAIGANLLDNHWIEGIIISFRIIEDRKKAENALKSSEDKFRNIFNQSFQFIALLKADGTLIQANQTLLECISKESSEVENTFFYENPCLLHSSEEQRKFKEAIERAAKGEIVRLETCKPMPDGQMKFFDFSIKPVMVEGDTIEQLIAEGRDITEQKLNEKREQEHLDFLNTLIETVPLPLYYKDVNGRYLGCNKSFETFIGYSKHQLIGLSTDQAYSFESDIEFLALDKTIPENQKTQKNEVNVQLKDGSHDIIIYRNVYRDSDNNVAGFIGAVFDITEIKRANAKVSESERKFRNIFSTSTDTILIMDLNLNILEINDIFFQETGFSRDDFANTTAIKLIAPKYVEETKKMLERLYQERIVYYFETDMIKANGEIMPVELNCKMIEYDNQEAIMTIVRDVTERRRWEQKLIDSIIETEERERERLAGDLHDEIGPLLSSMKMYITVLSETTDTEKQGYLYDQINMLVKESLQAVREISNDLSPHILNHYGIVAALSNFLGAKHSLIDIKFKSNCEKLRFDSHLEIIFYRIVKELFNNTLKHAAATTITIQINYHIGTITLDYKDNGKGFDLESTLKQEKKGIGLLNILSRLRSVQGKYQINTAPGKGFLIHIQAEATPIELSSNQKIF